jgi:hypothetical protein
MTMTTRAIDCKHLQHEFIEQLHRAVIDLEGILVLKSYSFHEDLLHLSLDVPPGLWCVDAYNRMTDVVWEQRWLALVTDGASDLRKEPYFAVAASGG